ncbi:MAG: hypothetical protein CXX80_08975 [Methanobacteriota archaeon]|nr:MAG: hypothetical protein CXX80_08975 [Euryarchaeota archaeon]
MAGYLVTKSAAAGLYILMMLGVISGYLPFDEMIVIGLLASIALLGLTGLLLVKDLDKPMRFIYVMLRPNWSSWLVRGGYTLGAFGAAMTAHLAIYFLGLPSQWHIWLAFAAIPLAWLTATYTGWLFKQAKGREMWANRSDWEIALTGTGEMLLFGGLPFILLEMNNWGLATSYTIPLLVAIILGVVYWKGYNHILHGLRKAQMEPLI